MTTLAPAYQHVDALSTLFGEVAAEKVMEIAAEKESNYVVSDRRLARAGKPPTGRWAILGDDGAVVGYLTGRLGGRIPDTDSEGAFVSMIVIAGSVRGAGHGWRAIRVFAELARGESGASVVGLRLDESGNVDKRRARFERIGFEFTGSVGTATIEELLSNAASSGEWT